MTQRIVPPSLSKDGLLGKSKVYIRRAFRAKQASELDEYQLWSSLALELLGKAALASIHPSLVADPTHFQSLFAASGINIGTDIKTIAAGTLYNRLLHLSKSFDTKVKEFCDTISLRRNAELHSGEAPFLNMHLDAWEGRYWHASQVILDILSSSLDEWLGADQARAPKEIVKQAMEAAVHAAKIRVQHAKEEFEKRPKKDREQALKESRSKQTYHYPELFNLMADHEWAVECPACTGRAFLAGISFGEEVIPAEPSDEDEQVEKYYGAEELRCPVCDLHLDSRAEIEAAGIDADHTETELREREYEPDYGNC
jgi:hypothetical protein